MWGLGAKPGCCRKDSPFPMPAGWESVQDVFQDVLQHVRNWTSSTVTVLDVRQHLRPSWVLPLDVRLMVILCCNPAFFQRINSFPEPCHGPAAPCNNFAWNYQSALSESLVLKVSSAPCFFLPASAIKSVSAVPWLWFQHKFCGPFSLLPDTSHCLQQGRLDPLDCAGWGDQSFHESPSSTKML